MQLHPIDVAVIVLYLLGITWFGLRFRHGERSLRSYFLADRNVPWWAIALSIVAAETSTLTIISIPGLAFTGDFGFLQIALGYLLGRIVICVLFLPRYFAGEMLTFVVCVAPVNVAAPALSENVTATPLIGFPDASESSTDGLFTDTA